MDKNEYNFQKLTPVSDIDLKIYEDAINYILDNADIKNVAISGAYSAGKSSVLESYKKNHNNRHFLHISLAHFRSPDQSEESQTKETILEGKILNQLMHQIPADKIPQTNFKVKKKIKTKNIVKNTIFLILFIVAVLHICMFGKWIKYVDSLPFVWLKKLLTFSTHNSSPLFSGLVCAIVSIIFIYSLVKMQMNKNIFRKFKLQGNEIEIFEEQKESYFDKYLNEVLYLFENASADVIVFEDMDRFNATEIFQRLREVNRLVNIQLKKVGKGPLRFFYLLRDDIFLSKDRTKFFDYILPVVPVLDSSNSYDQFISHFKKGGIFDLFDERFLQGLSLYTDDMRLLKNIYNEFVVYYNRLNTTELDCNKMLAMIAYKNLFPRDFSDLQLNKGMIFTLFDKKNEFIIEEIEKLKEVATLMKQEIELAKNEHLTTIQELDVVFNDKRIKLQNVNWSERTKLEQQYNSEYEERRKAIENVLNDRLHDMEDELSRIELKIVLTQSKQLKDIISRENIEIIFKVTNVNEIGITNDFSDIKGSDYFELLKYLIRNGYIDETYADYMTYFYENSLSRIDKTFLRSITDKKTKEYTYQLKNPKMVVDRLRAVDFDQEEILNFDMLQYLLQTPINEQFLFRFLSQLKETKNFKFIGAYFDTERDIPAYIANLNIKWTEIFSYMSKEHALSDKQIRLYSIYTLYHSNDDIIRSVNVDNCLTDYISNSADYLDINSPNIDKLIHGFALIGVSFASIDYDRADKGLFNAVYENSLFEINFENLEVVLRNIYLITNEANIRHKNYTLVMSESESPMALHVNNNIREYLDIILSNCDGLIDDTEEIVILVLNNDTVSIEQKNEYIRLLQTPITNINDVENNSLWAPLLDKRLVSYSEDNIFVYFDESKELDSTIITFINGEDSKLDFSKVKSTFGEEETQKLFDAAVICNDISNDKYAEILCSLGFYYDSFNISGISDEKFRIIVDEKIVRMNLETLLFIRENYPSQTLYYIEKNMNEYVGTISNDSLDFGEMMEILSWQVDDEIKFQLLKFTDQPLSILRKGYSNDVNAYVLRNNLERSDLSDLAVSYESWDSSIQEIIYELAVQNIGLINNQQPLKPSNKLFRKMLESNDLVEDNRIELFISSLPGMDEDMCKENLGILGLAEFVKLFGRGRPKFEINSKNERLLTALKNNNWIYDFPQDEENTGYYKIIKRGPSTKSMPPELL